MKTSSGKATATSTTTTATATSTTNTMTTSVETKDSGHANRMFSFVTQTPRRLFSYKGLHPLFDSKQWGILFKKDVNFLFLLRKDTIVFIRTSTNSLEQLF